LGVFLFVCVSVLLVFVLRVQSSGSWVSVLATVSWAGVSAWLAWYSIVDNTFFLVSGDSEFRNVHVRVIESDVEPAPERISLVFYREKALPECFLVWGWVWTASMSRAGFGSTLPKYEKISHRVVATLLEWRGLHGALVRRYKLCGFHIRKDDF
jgi:hypothetical protein